MSGGQGVMVESLGGNTAANATRPASRIVGSLTLVPLTNSRNGRQ